jgi:starvation-inducible DNA-binding protein
MGSNGRHPLHPTRIDISSDVRAQVIDILNQSLASTLDLKTQVKQAHWNVKGMDFYQLHELFDEMASELEEFVDMLAERVTALGGLALGTARIAATKSTLPEYPLDILEGKEHVTALADRYAMYAKSVREGIAKTDELGDADTADLYTEISRAIDKRLWFLEAHLQAVSADVVVTVQTTNAEPKKTAAKSKTTTASKTATPKTTPKVETTKTTVAKTTAAKPKSTSSAKTTATQTTTKTSKTATTKSTPPKSTESKMKTTPPKSRKSPKTK